MAYRDKIISNPITGQSIRFIRTAQDTNAKVLEMEATYNSFSKEPSPHYHPLQTEYFLVKEGELTVRMTDRVVVLKEGDKLEIAPGTIHTMWNNSNEKTVVNWQVRPALNTEFFLETAIGLVNDQQTNDKGIPPLLQLALLANRYSLVYRNAKPSYFLQQLVFTILTPVAYLLGYKAWYPRYIN